MKLFINQKGFSLIEGLLVVLVLTAVMGVGYYVYQGQNKSVAQKTNNAAKAQPSQIIGKTYTSKVGNFSVMYPENWLLKDNGEIVGEESPSSEAVISDPAGKVKLRLYTNFGGRGGACDPGPNDEPFKAGNACPSSEILSIEKLPITNVYYAAQTDQKDGSIKFVFKPTNIVLITRHYADQDGKSQYIVGANNSDDSLQLVANRPEMGAFGAEEYITVYDAKEKFHPYIYIYASSDDPSFLKSTEADKVKRIIRSLKINI